MVEQNVKNHARIVPMYHFVAATAIVISLVCSSIHFFRALSVHSGRLNAASSLLSLFAIVLIYWFCRSFALKAQDRAIRAEENLRHFAITGKLLDSKLRIGQIVALRFASNDEFVDLARRAAEENMSQKEIKNAIQHWKGDYYRV